MAEACRWRGFPAAARSDDRSKPRLQTIV